MGEVISKHAAATDIFADVTTTLIAASVRGTRFQTDAEARLRAVSDMGAEVTAELAAADQALEPLRLAIVARADEARKLVGAVHDEMWNALGRPGNDPWLALYFPNGIGTQTSGPVVDVPVKLSLLAKLLRHKIHPAFPAARSVELADGIAAAAAAALHSACEALRTPKAEHTMLASARQAVAKSAQMSLAGLKRHWKSNGLSEVVVHTLIPDRPSKTAATRAAQPQPQPQPTPRPTPDPIAEPDPDPPTSEGATAEADEPAA